MRPPLLTRARIGAPLLVAVLALGGCGGGQAEDDAAGPGSSGQDSSAPESPAPSDPADPSDPSEPADPSAPPSPDGERTACDEVVAGIDAFNVDDYDETVDHFVDAVPLARAELRQAQSRGTSQTVQQAELLLEAVRWYADLPAEDYAEAFRTSMDFKRYQAITLGQCGNGQTPGSPGDGSVEA